MRDSAIANILALIPKPADCNMPAIAKSYNLRWGHIKILPMQIDYKCRGRHSKALSAFVK